MFINMYIIQNLVLSDKLRVFRYGDVINNHSLLISLFNVCKYSLRGLGSLPAAIEVMGERGGLIVGEVVIAALLVEEVRPQTRHRRS